MKPTDKGKIKMTPIINLFVRGFPKGQPRPRAFARKFGTKWSARVYDAGTAENWKSCIADAWRRHCPDHKPIQGAVGLTLHFWLSRPKSHYTKQGLRLTAPICDVRKPDVDNYAKAVMDCLTTIGAWRDDSQVVELHVTKRFAATLPGCSITIMEAVE